MILSLSLFLCVFASYAQDARLSLTGNNLTLRELFRQIEEQTDFNIGHSNRINIGTTIEVAEQSGTVMQLLSEALKETNYTYRRIGNYILIVPYVPEVEEEVPPPPPVREEPPVVVPVVIEEEPEIVYIPVIEETPPPPPYIPEIIEEPEPEEEIILPSIVRENFPPRFILKTNVLYAATGTINFGAEFRLNNHLTLDIVSGWNPFVFGNDRQLTHVLVQPTLRYWVRESFRGDFFGLSLMYINYNMGGISLPFNIMPGLANHRFRGNAYGVSLQYGHQWRFSPRWGIESTINVGHLFLDYQMFERGRYGEKIDSNVRHFFGPTNASISVIYFFR